MLPIDRQTLKDLELFNAPDGNPGFFSRMVAPSTNGGYTQLREKFSRFLTTKDEIMRVQEGLRFLLEDPERWKLPFKEEQFAAIHQYLDSNVAPIFGNTRLLTLLGMLKYRLLYRSEYDYVWSATHKVFFFLREMRLFTTRLQSAHLPELLQQWAGRVENAMNDSFVGQALNASGRGFSSSIALFEFDRNFRTKGQAKIRELLELFYEWDAWLSMARTIRKYEFVFPELVETSQTLLQLDGLYHPLVPSAVRNPVDLGGSAHFVFLTGPNMAGKTTYMKACALAVYLAHVGMGIPAAMGASAYSTGFSPAFTPPITSKPATAIFTRKFGG